MSREAAPRSGEGGDGDFARAVVTEAMRRYFDERRSRVVPFIDRHFSLAGALALHRRALGWDLLRSPANLVLAVPNAGAKLAAAALGAVGAGVPARRLRDLRLLLETDVGREMQWLVMTELLELPFEDGARISGRDALAEAVLSHPRVEAIAREALTAISERTGDADFRSRLESALATYTDTRAAAADIATTLSLLGTGALTVHQVTPGAITLGPALAAAVAQQSAIAAFPLGSALGSLWYGVFPAVASPALVVGMTGGLLVGVAALGAFAGIAADPIQRRLGLHRRRLHRLLAALETSWMEGSGGVFIVRDHYVARLLGFLDLLASAWRIARS